MLMLVILMYRAEQDNPGIEYKGRSYTNHDESASAGHFVRNMTFSLQE